MSLCSADSGGSTSASSLAAALQSEIRRRAENRTPGQVGDQCQQENTVCTRDTLYTEMVNTPSICIVYVLSANWYISL